MTPLETLLECMRDAEQRNQSVVLEPGLTAEQIDEYQASLGVVFDADIRRLLSHAQGFRWDGFPGDVYFGGISGFGFDCFHVSVALCDDGAGNFWAVDIEPRTGHWGPVFYVCHDPPVVVIQSTDIGEFIRDVFEPVVDGRGNQIRHVLDECVTRIWLGEKHQGRAAVDCKASADTVLRDFSSRFSDNTAIMDLRSREVGTGFAWARWRADDMKLVGHEVELLFALQYMDERRGLLPWLVDLLGFRRKRD